MQKKWYEMFMLIKIFIHLRLPVFVMAVLLTRYQEDVRWSVLEVLPCCSREEQGHQVPGDVPRHRLLECNTHPL